jgi:hypothetical protein
MIQLYEKWNNMVIATVPQDRLVVFETGVDGWEKLCSALSVPIPTEKRQLDNGTVVSLPLPYPHVNTGEDYRNMVFAQKSLAVMLLSTPMLLLVLMGLCLYKRYAKRWLITRAHMDSHEHTKMS